MRFQKMRVLSAILSFVFILAVFAPIVQAKSEAYEKAAAKIDPVLSEKMSNTDNKISIVIWLKDPDFGERIKEINCQIDLIATKQVDALSLKPINAKANNPSLKQLVQEKQSLVTDAVSKHTQLMSKQIAEYADITLISTAIPTIHAVASPNNIRKIALLPQVDTIYDYNPRYKPAMDISRQAIRANLLQQTSYGTLTGNNVKVGIIENCGLPSVSSLGIPANKYVLDTNPGTTIDNHATYVASVIAGQGGTTGYTKGIAPNVNLYCSYVTDNYSLYSSLLWMKNHGVSIVCISFWCDQYSDYNTYHYEDRVVDYFSFSHNITIVVAAGNMGFNGVTTPGMAYNAITVGNVNDKNTVSVSDDALYFNSGHRNVQYPTYYASKPDICAPGTKLNIGGANRSGTSFSAPHVAGAIAQLAQYDDVMNHVPWAAKAVLMAGVNMSFHHYVPSNRTPTDNGSLPESSYIQYGAGLLDCVNAYNILHSVHYDFGYFPPNDSSLTYSISCVANQKQRLVVAWPNHCTTFATGPDIIPDLDVEVWNSSGSTCVASSITAYNNVEIVEFTPTSTGTYWVYVDRNDMMSHNLWFALAWN